jgi:UDP-glucose 4-epimerase
MKVLITGGAGYVGCSLINEILLNQKDIEEIIVYDNLSRKNYNLFISGCHDSEKVKFVRGEILNSRKMEKLMQGIDLVYHLAARVTTPFADHDAHLFEQVNHWGTAEMVMHAEKCKIKGFVYVSSASVYGNTSMAVNESSPLSPSSFYGSSKARAERHVQRLGESGIPFYIVRLGNVYGFNPCIRFDAVMNKFMFNAHFSGKITINGNGEQYRAFIHIDKAAKLLAGISVSGTEPGIYNLAEHNMTVNQISAALKVIYPNLEMLFINQHLKMREIKIELPCKITSKIPLNKKSFEEELEEFATRFSF